MSEFLSEDIYGGLNNFYSGLPEAQPWQSMQGFTSPYGVYGINQAGLLAQQNLPVDASGLLNIGVDLDTQAIQDQVNQNLTNLDNENPFGIPEYEDIERQNGLLERLNSMLGGIGQSELQGIWADPTVQEILTANSIRMTPDGPVDGELYRMSPQALEQLIQAIQGIESGEIVVDPNNSTLPGDTTGGDTTTGGEQEGGEQEGGEEEESESWLDRLSNWWDSVVNSVGGGGSGSTAPTLPGSSGVIISPGSAGMSWPQILSNPGAWQVFLPGVIPGLPQSPTIIGTIEDILSSPGDVLGDLWEQVQNTVENPGEFLEDLLNGVVDEDGNVTIGGISTVVGTIYDDLFGEDDTTTTPGTGDEEVEDDLPLGGDEDDDPNRSPDFPGGEAPVPDEEDDPIGGAEDDSSGGGGGGGGGVPSGGNAKDYMYRLQYNPDAPMSVPGGMFTEAPQRRRLRAPELGQPSMVQGLLLGRT